MALANRFIYKRRHFVQSTETVPMQLYYIVVGAREVMYIRGFSDRLGELEHSKPFWISWSPFTTSHKTRYTLILSGFPGNLENLFMWPRMSAEHYVGLFLGSLCQFSILIALAGVTDSLWWTFLQKWFMKEIGNQWNPFLKLSGLCQTSR